MTEPSTGRLVVAELIGTVIVMLGGPERKHLFISTSASHDPAEILRTPSASFQVVEVDVPGAGVP